MKNNSGISSRQIIQVHTIPTISVKFSQIEVWKTSRFTVDVYCIPSCHPPRNHRGKLWIQCDENPIADIVPARIRCLHRALDQVDEKAGKVWMVWMVWRGRKIVIQGSKSWKRMENHQKVSDFGDSDFKKPRWTAVKFKFRYLLSCSLSPAAIIGLASQVFFRKTPSISFAPPHVWWSNHQSSSMKQGKQWNNCRRYLGFAK